MHAGSSGFQALEKSGKNFPMFGKCRRGLRRRYEDADGTQYEEEYKIDLRAQRQLLRVGKKDVGDELEKISDVLKSLVAAQK